MENTGLVLFGEKICLANSYHKRVVAQTIKFYLNFSFYQTLLGEQEKPQERALLGTFFCLTSQFDICHIMYLPKP